MIAIDDIPEVLRGFPEHLKVIQSPYEDCYNYHRAIGGDSYIPCKYPSLVKFNINRASYKLGGKIKAFVILLGALD